MKVLVIGNGAREHVLCKSLNNSHKVSEVFVAPGNGGTRECAVNISINSDDIAGLLSFVQSNYVDVTVVGPEIPLSLGIVDLFEENGLNIFGPTKSAAQIESSKLFAKNLLVEIGVPTADFCVVDDYQQVDFDTFGFGPPYVIKADGLAAGKGVSIVDTVEEASLVLRAHLVDKTFGCASEKVIIEQFLLGKEISVFGFVDGSNVSSLTAACDYKKIYEGNKGPNTGGMGGYSPPEPSLWNKAIENWVMDNVMQPVVDELKKRGTPYKGILYAGLIKTEDGLKVLEFNCRFGDPEAQLIIPRIENDLVDVIADVVEERIKPDSVKWDSEASVGVVMVSEGYPDKYEVGYEIEGIDLLGHNVQVFHAGTTLKTTEKENRLETAGGRVLTLLSKDKDLNIARDNVYRNISSINFNGATFRQDIALLNQSNNN